MSEKFYPYGHQSIDNDDIEELKRVLKSDWITQGPKIKEFEKAIQKSDLGMNPMNDGKMIQISIPNLSEERRKELVKIVKKVVEDSKVSLRNHRRSINEKLKHLKKDRGNHGYTSLAMS